MSCDVGDESPVDNGSGPVPVGDVSVDDERGVNSGAGVTGGGAEVSVAGDEPGIAPDAGLAGLVRLDGGAGDVDVPTVSDEVLGFAEVDHLTFESRMLMGAGGGGASTPPGIMVLDKPGAGPYTGLPSEESRGSRWSTKFEPQDSAGAKASARRERLTRMPG